MSVNFPHQDVVNSFNLFIFRNKSDQTLLHMVALQGPELEEQKLLILRREIEIHCNKYFPFSFSHFTLHFPYTNVLIASTSTATSKFLIGK